MADRRVLADTTLFIEHLRSREKTASFLYSLASEVQVETSAIVAAEVYYGARTAEAEERATHLLRSVVIHPFTREMALRQGVLVRELQKQNRIPHIRDSMISACALELALPLATLNRAHFEFVPGLILSTPEKR